MQNSVSGWRISHSDEVRYKFVCCPWRRTLLVQFWYSTGIIKARLMSEPFLSYMENLGSERALPLFPT